MNPTNQKNLYGFDKLLKDFINLYNNEKLPNKIIFTGQKGIGKSTLSYHLINSILSKDEQYPYDLKNFSINDKNRTFKLIQNKSHPNFNLIDVLPEKKSIDIAQIRQLLIQFNKSSFNDKPRFILIDNIEFLNINSVNALLKFLEEPSDNTFFLLIHNQKNIPSTLRSRCLEFKIFFSNEEMIKISNKLLDNDVYDLVNIDLLNYYFTPGKIFNLNQFAKENKLNLKEIDLYQLLCLLIDKGYYKKDKIIKTLIFDLMEAFLLKKIKNNCNLISNNVLKKINDIRKFNLDEDSLFIDFKDKVLNG